MWWKIIIFLWIVMAIFSTLLEYGSLNDWHKKTFRQRSQVASSLNARIIAVPRIVELFGDSFVNNAYLLRMQDLQRQIQESLKVNHLNEALATNNQLEKVLYQLIDDQVDYISSNDMLNNALSSFSALQNKLINQRNKFNKIAKQYNIMVEKPIHMPFVTLMRLSPVSLLVRIDQGSELRIAQDAQKHHTTPSLKQINEKHENTSEHHKQTTSAS